MLTRDHNTDLLKDEISKLKTWLSSQQLHYAYEHVLHIYRKLNAGLDYANYTPYYLEDARAVNAVLTNTDGALDTLLTRAEATIGTAIPERKAMGIAIAVLGISLLVLSALLITTVIACAFPLVGLLVLAAGTATVTFGIGFFRSGLQTGMAKQLNELHKADLRPVAIN